MATFLTQFGSHWRVRWYLWHGAQISPPCRLGTGARLSRGIRAGLPGTIRLGSGAELQDGVILDAWGGSIVLGAAVFVGPYTVIYGHGGVAIGDHTLVSMHCRILSSNHSVPAIGVDIRSQPDVLQATRIGRDVWLGAGVTVLAGVSIGEGCVIGAGAVVTRDLPPGAIAAGVPARIIGNRPSAPGP